MDGPVRRTGPTRRQFLLGLGAAGVLAACGDDSQDADVASAPGPASPTGSPASATREVVTDAGPLEVPSAPQRVVAAIGSFETDMVAVGVMPVLTTSFAGPWVELDDDVVVTENIPPTAEELARVRPDLIVGWSWVTEEPVYDEIVQIAPYVGLGESEATVGDGFDAGRYLSWDTLFLSVADAVGRREEGERLVADFEARVDEVAARRAGQPPLRVARVEFYETGTFSYRGQDEDTAELMRRIGLTVVGPETSVNEESLERLPEIEADLIVVPVGGGMPPEVFAEIEQNPLWQAIPAVQAGRVEQVDGELWPGLGFLWAGALLTDLERLFVDA
ncbi:MAG: ABC transporter substrate-binding protein [Acidimicrobiia bacterium]